MAQDVKILTWNIQQYGKTKVTFNDIVNSIAKVVVDANPDIFILLELNTTINSTAKNLMTKMGEALYRLSAGNYRKSVLSPNTGKEFYGFFIKNTANTVPLIPVRKVGGGNVAIIGDGYLDYSEVEFRRQTAAGGNVEVLQQFPLLSPDLERFRPNGSSLGVPDWPGVRLPALGTFWCPNATGNERLLPIAVCHFAAKHWLALRQVQTLKYFSLFQGIGPTDTNGVIATNPVTVDVRVGGGSTPVTVQNYVLTGDFNLNYISDNERDSYNYIVGNAFPNLGANLYITEGTHLVTYANYNRNMKFTLQLAVNDYDNLMLRTNTAVMSNTDAGAAGVRDVPDLIRQRLLKLYQAVDHYNELDKKGFSGGDYSQFAVNFGRQLSRAGGFIESPINIEGSLVGARLISDHLPVYFTVRLQ